MKKIALFAAALAVVACMVPAIAGAAPSTNEPTVLAASEACVVQACMCYVDKDNGGVCDNRATEIGACPTCPAYVDEDNDGVCDNREAALESNDACPGYTDEDGDGVYDNLESNGVNQQGACGNGACMGCGGDGGGNGRCGR